MNLGSNFDPELAAVRSTSGSATTAGRLRRTWTMTATSCPESRQSPPGSAASSSARLHQWEAFIKIAGTQENLGFFDDGEDAAQAYDTWARKLNRILDLEPK